MCVSSMRTELELNPDLLPGVIKCIPMCITNARAVNRTWRDALEPLFTQAVIARSLDRVVQYVVVSLSGGECIGCGIKSHPLLACLSCGAPIAPLDGSWHYHFGWVEGPRREDNHTEE